jgi:PiT family inorganic phosphate transporter
MGLPVSQQVITPKRALALMAPLALIGAVFLSHPVERTVGFDLINGSMTRPMAITTLAVAFLLTTFFNRIALPTSTIQILVFSLIGVACANAYLIKWSVVGWLVFIWMIVPCISVGLGYIFTLSFDKIIKHGYFTDTGMDRSALILVVIGCLASLTMGANDVSNATGVLVGTGTYDVLAAGLIGGIGLAAGVVLWGKPLLNRVAFDIVTVDRSMAIAAQTVQGVTVLVAASCGFFTSMNQALVSAMLGAGLARGQRTVHRPVLTNIAKGWIIGPIVAGGAGWVAGWLVLVLR